MIPVGIDDLFDLAFDMRGQIRQYGRGGFTFHDRLAVDRAAPGGGGEENRRTISCCPLPTIWSAATLLSARHSNTLLCRRTAAMIRGGLKETCDTR